MDSQFAKIDENKKIYFISEWCENSSQVWIVRRNIHTLSEPTRETSEGRSATFELKDFFFFFFSFFFGWDHGGFFFLNFSFFWSQLLRCELFDCFSFFFQFFLVFFTYVSFHFSDFFKRFLTFKQNQGNTRHDRPRHPPINQSFRVSKVYHTILKGRNYPTDWLNLPIKMIYQFLREMIVTNFERIDFQ